jgi:hypothetical protein
MTVRMEFQNICNNLNVVEKNIIFLVNVFFLKKV